MKVFRKGFVVLFIILLIIISLSIFWKNWQTFLKSDIIQKNHSAHIFFSNGDTIRNLADILTKKANLKNPIYLIWYVRLKGESTALKAGEYNFIGPMTPYELIQQIKEGKVVQHKITFVEGFTIANIINELNHNPNIKHDITNLTKKELLLKLNIKQKHLEGLFFPDTYNYIYGTTDLALLKIAHERMIKILHKEWKMRGENLPYKTPYQALIMASMIEKEASLEKERQLIAGVILNRLKKHMYLQIDPTVIYGVGTDFNGKITLADLRANNPYNTYLHKGLPPSPICLPGKNAIYAALHPSKTDYLYFVAKGDGSHIFSRTLKQHDENIKEYILKDSKIDKSNVHANKKAKIHNN